MAEIVYKTVKNTFRDDGASKSDKGAPIRPAVQMSPRHEAMADVYHPHLMVAHDTQWLRSRLKDQAPEMYRDERLDIYLVLGNYEVIRRAISVRLSNYEHLPDITEDQRTYRKVCRAKLTIQPNIEAAKKAEPITLIYSLNAEPRSRRTPLYIPINFFEATEPPLPFSLSDSERTALKMMGFRGEPDQDPILRIRRKALRGFRNYVEGTTALVEEAPAAQQLRP